MTKTSVVINPEATLNPAQIGNQVRIGLGITATLMALTTPRLIKSTKTMLKIYKSLGRLIRAMHLVKAAVNRICKVIR
ncbi:hypothetical protein [Cellvibrio sp. NN19]|uniref:hypothetical protein n=1 Tax=Cellvibrio chitinivorans TaxID=3102792 RepID=UPI002B4036C9|nr:hypothetical protein [Cellvibrio sp. NN19]